MHWTELEFANSSVKSCIGMHVFRTGWAPAVLVSPQPIKSLCWFVCPLNTSCNWVDLLQVSSVQFMYCNKPLLCMLVCQVLGVYTFTKRVNLDDGEAKPRRAQGYSTVSHFNVIHIECHLAAVRLVSSWCSSSSLALFLLLTLPAEYAQQGLCICWESVCLFMYPSVRPPSMSQQQHAVGKCGWCRVGSVHSSWT